MPQAKVKRLWSGNEAIGAGAIAAGCRGYFGYPITPQNELVEYMANYMVEAGGVFLQAESELAAINMVFGAAACGVRCMTSSSSPGMSLMQEGLSYIAAARLGCVVVNVMRGGPGLGNIAPAQSDYFQATRSGGHGDYHCIVLAPYSVKECFTLTVEAFNLADEYRTPTILLLDAAIGQMSEELDVDQINIPIRIPKKDWALTGAKNRPPNVIKTLYLEPHELAQHNRILQETYRRIEERECRLDALYYEDAEYFFISYGICARICLETIELLRKKNIKIGLLRPITLYPFPKKELAKYAKQAKAVMVVELSHGQLLEDVKLSLPFTRIEFCGKSGGLLITPEELFCIFMGFYQTQSYKSGGAAIFV